MAQQMYYEKPALLDREKHRHRRVTLNGGFAFARKSNSLYLAAVEFNEACKEYPIVFTRSPNGKTVPVAVLGLRDRENLFVDGQARWVARYLPAFLRRYPFVLAELPGDGSLAVCIDEAYPGLGDTEGEALFEADGKETPFLKQTLDFLTRYQREAARTEAFCKKLEEHGLLKETSARADLRDGRSFTVNGLLVVDEEKLMKLPDAVALEMLRSGELHLITAHLLSLSNIQLLADRLAQRPEVAAAPAAA
ncbi:MAG TPA: SapC family protein [Ramlibacter sp.]|uniref:SapC family protein n=1 Tax=Ramlibacter sp. TaxID=1917967 RepID=UPI002D80A733|nr:SapC family protein [Ramlibacter sp.]HET8748864.1 SapC family protein [Ramlibacter sp.]